MALPIGVQKVTVHIGNSFAVAGTEAAISGTISPIFGGTVRRAIWQATGGALSSVTERFESIDGGEAFVQVPDPHQAGWLVPETGADGQTLHRAISDWGYRVDAVARFPGGGQEAITKTFKIAPGQTSVDLDLVADGQVVSGVQGPYVPAGGAYPVQHVELTEDIPDYTLPLDAPLDQVVTVVFTQDGTGGHTVTYGGAPVTVDTTAGAVTTVELHPTGSGFVVRYPVADLDAEVAALAGDAGSAVAAALASTFEAMETTSDKTPQEAITLGIAGDTPARIVGSHVISRSGGTALTLPTGATLLGRPASIVALDSTEAAQPSLSHFATVGSPSAGASDITVEGGVYTASQAAIARWSRIATRQVAEDNSYCTITTIEPHRLSVGAIAYISDSELVALNGARTVSEILSPTQFRVTGVSSSNKSVVAQRYLAMVNQPGVAAGVGSIDGFSVVALSNATAGVDRVTIRDVTISDTSNAVRCTASRGVEEGVFHHDWRVTGVRGDAFTNKVIEFGFLDGGEASSCRFTNCNDGVQAIFWSRNITFRDIHQEYYDSGVNITSGAHDILIEGCRSVAMADAPKLTHCPALIFRTENTSGMAYDCYNIRSIGNVYRSRVSGGAQVAACFQTASAVTSALYRDMQFVGDLFDGKLMLYDVQTPAKTTIKRLRFTGCRIGSLETVAAATCNVSDVTFVDCDFFDAGVATTINASNIEFIGCRFFGAVTVAAGATNVVMQNCRTVGAITDSGTGTVLANNRAV